MNLKNLVIFSNLRHPLCFTYMVHIYVYTLLIRYICTYIRYLYGTYIHIYYVMYMVHIYFTYMLHCILFIWYINTYTFLICYIYYISLNENKVFLDYSIISAKITWIAVELIFFSKVQHPLSFTYRVHMYIYTLLICHIYIYTLLMIHICKYTLLIWYIYYISRNANTIFLNYSITAALYFADIYICGRIY